MVGVRKCCCVPSTLWKIDPSDGTVTWKRDRGANSVGVDVRTSGANVLIYECGVSTGGADDFLLDRLTDGASPSLDWTYSNSMLNRFNDVKYSAGDGVIWATAILDDTLVTIDDSDGSELATGTRTNIGGFYPLFDGPNGTMNVATDDATTRVAAVWQYSDPSTLDVSSAAFGQPAAVNGDSAGTGFLNVIQTGLFPPLTETAHILDTVLASTDSATLDVEPVPVQCSSATAWLISVSGTLYSLDASSLSTTNWTKSGFSALLWGSALGFGLPAAYDGSDNLYMFQDASGTDTAVRIGASGGATDWSNTDVTITTLRQIIVDSTFMYVCGKGTLSGSNVQVWAYDITDGSLDWSRKLGDGTGAAQDMVLHGGNLYVCGDRM